MIRRAIAAVFVALLITASTGCGQSGPSSEEERIQQLEQERTRLTEEKQQEEEARKAAEQGAGRWKFYTIVVAFFLVPMLVLGAGLGSSAKKEAQRLSLEEQRKGKDED